MKRLLYWITYGAIWLLALLPMRAVYVLSDLFCFIMEYVVRYRRRVINANLRRSFPEKSEAELRRIRHRFYRYICDYMLEELKLLRMSFAELCRRMDYQKKELFLEMLDRHGSIILLIPHYANFEWIIGMGAILPEGGIPLQVYKPLHDSNLDHLFRHIRARFGGHNVPRHGMAREVLKLRAEGKHLVIGLITDQSPNLNEAHYWTTFLNQDTGFIDSGERLGKRLQIPVFYCDLQRLDRGHCRVSFDLLSETPQQTPDGEITEQFARRLEQTIRRDPPYWFWSHRRWKFTREEVHHGQ